jgi:hypothetical protein
MRKLSKMLNQVGDRSGTLGFASQKGVEKIEIATFRLIENKTDLQSLAVKDVSAILIADNSILESYSPPPSLVIGLDLREQNEISNKSQYAEIDFALVSLNSNWRTLESEDCGLVLELDLSEETSDITELIQLLQGKQALPLDAILLSGGISEDLGTIKNQLNLRRFNEAVGLPLIIAESSADSDPDQLRALGIKGLMA